MPVELNYKQIGSGRPLIILHGLFGSLDNWQTLARYWGEAYEVFTVDQRNHGQSPHTEEMSYELMADDLADFIEQHQIQKPVIAGHSMGGKTVMKLALTRPELISGLIVMDMAPKSYRVHHQSILDALKSVNFEQVRRRKEVEDALSAFIPQPGVIQFLTKNVYWKEKDRLAYRFNLNVLDQSIETLSGWNDQDDQYQGETLFLKGGKSDYVLADEHSIDRYFSSHRIQTVEGAGHWVHAENPEAVFDAVKAFIEGLEG